MMSHLPAVEGVINTVIFSAVAVLAVVTEVEFN
jgi:hypothetical protein